MLDLKPTTHDDHRLRTNVLPGESNGVQQQLSEYIKMPPIFNAMYNTKQQMEDEKSALYSNLCLSEPIAKSNTR